MPPVRQNAKKASKPRAALVIAIDFGTTNSGVACGLTSDRVRSGQAKLEVIRGWPATRRSQRDLQKVPTRLHYGEDGQISWGYDIPDDVKPLQWFKLLLLDKDDFPGYLRGSTHLQEAQDMIRQLGKDATTVTADYLRLLWQHTLESLKKIRGKGLVESTPFHVVLTVPAVWPEIARNRMRKAAEDAGILDRRLGGVTSLKFISEPEAAAISILYSELDDRPDLKTGTKFIVCDCGGGTVDIISYEVVKVKPEVKVKECTVGTGGLCGATFLDQAFFNHFLGIVGRLTWDKYDARRQKSIMNNGWEQLIKPGFDGTGGPWVMDVDGPVSFDNDELNRVFKSVIDQIVHLVKDQVRDISEKATDAGGQATPQFVILAGGFGRCAFLYEYLQKELDDEIEILQPQGSRPWSAICRGAALSEILQKSLVGPVLQRKARQSYGWVVEAEWDPEKHIEGVDKKEFDAIRGEWIALRQIDWVIHAGDDISSNVVPLSYSLAFPMDQSGSVEYHSEVYKTQSPDPPRRLDPKDRSVQKVGELRLEFPVPVERLPIRNNGEDETYRALDYVAHGEVSGNSIDFRGSYKGQTVG
ncbi:uncharacterized protein PG986_002774 [Apiospora aurea]|uniref:Actin-like ATPase domain-containing protein n=1 Tax=Apiospora aurea TaxID=335848 RepID=A0ABR1QQD0_9PEZI